MKNIDKKVIVFLFMMLFASLIFVSKELNKEIYMTIYCFVVFVFSIAAFKYQKDRPRYKVDYIQVIIIYTLLYLVISYLGGLAFGFSKSPYSMKIIKILTNISLPILCILFQEVTRYVLIKDRNKYKLIFIMLVITFSAMEIFFEVNLYDWESSLGIYDGISNLIIPIIAKNLVLTYLTSNCGLGPSLIYRLTTELYPYFIPIIPEYGIYITSVIGIVFPTIIYLKFNNMLSNIEYKAKGSTSFLKKIIYFPIIALAILIVLLVSNTLKYVSISIGSASMEPTINTGDVVVLEKLNEDEIESIKIDDILVYRHENKIIIHRVIGIREGALRKTFSTKGDNNESGDYYDVSESDVIGIVKFRIPYIGYPSVWLGEKLG